MFLVSVPSNGSKENPGWSRFPPGGEVLLAFHVGDERRHLDMLWEHRVSLDFLFYPRVLIEDHLRGAGFEIVESLEREPYEGIEVATQRAYLRARK